MSEDTTEGLSDKEMNFEKLRQKTEGLEARLAELEPLAVAKAVREAGFNPDADRGKALADLVGPGATVEKVKEVAARYGWEPEPPRPVLTATEQAALSSADRLSALNSVTTSEPPVTLVSQIKEAEAKGDWSTVTRLNSQLLAQQMAAKARG